MAVPDNEFQIFVLSTLDPQLLDDQFGDRLLWMIAQGLPLPENFSSSTTGFELAKLRLNKGPSANDAAGIVGGITARQGAAIKDHIHIALLWIENDTKVSAPLAMREGRTAIDGAAEHGRLDMIRPASTEYDSSAVLQLSRLSVDCLTAQRPLRECWRIKGSPRGASTAHGADGCIQSKCFETFDVGARRAFPVPAIRIFLNEIVTLRQLSSVVKIAYEETKE
ncbi:hypothetical protein FQN50_009362 [Emmonsiellopsis sp. PD_5]|nr:hypothetical protein FQN50_009362 [Emmonsiellopsis sp. PD_5]